MTMIIPGMFPLSASSPLCEFDPDPGSDLVHKVTVPTALPGFTGLAGESRPFLVLNSLKDCRVNTLRVGDGEKPFRTPKCLCFGNPGKEYGIGWNAARQRAGYKGFWVCGSVWTCPVCGQRICQQRAEDLTRLINVHTGRGGDVYLSTFTAPHGPGENLRRRMDLFQRAYDGAMKCKAVMNFKRSAGFIGGVTSKEVTHGVNGFHDHYHTLWFTTKPIYRDVMEFVIFEQWRNYCLKRGLGEPSPEGFDVRMGSAAGDYVSKLGWNVAAEVALSGEKRGRGESRHPFDLVLDWSRGEFPAGLDLFMEYAGATWRRQYMTSYARLARKLGVDLEVLTDEQIARRADREFVLKFLFSESAELMDLWRGVVRHGKRSQVLRFFESEMRSHSDIERAKSALVNVMRSFV
jgi:hypothetical protein